MKRPHFEFDEGFCVCARSLWKDDGLWEESLLSLLCPTLYALQRHLTGLFATTIHYCQLREWMNGDEGVLFKLLVKQHITWKSFSGNTGVTTVAYYYWITHIKVEAVFHRKVQRSSYQTHYSYWVSLLLSHYVLLLSIRIRAHHKWHLRNCEIAKCGQ